MTGISQSEALNIKFAITQNQEFSGYWDQAERIRHRIFFRKSLVEKNFNMGINQTPIRPFHPPPGKTGPGRLKKSLKKLFFTLYCFQAQDGDN